MNAVGLVLAMAVGLIVLKLCFERFANPRLREESPSTALPQPAWEV